MDYFFIHPDDARWLGRWLRGNLIGVAILGGLWTVASWQAPKSDASVDVPVESVSQIPDGWRRTARGWEDASKWPPPPRPLGDWIRDQQSREPVWVSHTMETLREVSPLAFAIGQVATIGTIVILMRPRDESVDPLP